MDWRKGPNARWIAVDVDGVLAAHVPHVLPILKRDFDVEVSLGQVTTLDFPVRDTTFGAIIRSAQKSPDFVLTTPIIEGARDAMQRLSMSYAIAIVTSRPVEAISSTREWLGLHDIRYDYFANLADGGKHFTAMTCDLLIDDYKLNIVEFLRNTNGSAILFSQPWNFDQTDLDPYVGSARLVRATAWRDVIDLVPQFFKKAG